MIFDMFGVGVFLPVPQKDATALTDGLKQRWSGELYGHSIGRFRQSLITHRGNWGLARKSWGSQPRLRKGG